VAVAGVGSQNLVPAHTQAGSRQTGLASIQGYLPQRLRTIPEGHSAGGRADERKSSLHCGGEGHRLAKLARVARAGCGHESATAIEEHCNGIAESAIDKVGSMVAVEITYGQSIGCSGWEVNYGLESAVAISEQHT